MSYTFTPLILIMIRSVKTGKSLPAPILRYKVEINKISLLINNRSQ